MLSKDFDIQKNSMFSKACELASLGDTSQSLAIFFSLEKIYPQDAHLKFLIASLAYHGSDYAIAKEKLEICIELDCQKKQANHLLGNVYREMGLLGLSLDAYEKEIALNPHYPDVLNDMGIALYRLNRIDDALKSYTRAHDLDKGYADPLHNKAIILIQQKKFSEAEESLQSAIKLKLKNYAAISTLANLKKYLCSFEIGWDLYKHRFESELLNEKKYFKKPNWFDPSAQNKNIYLYCEQGIGDQILYGTMFKEAFETENNFIVSIDERLIPIFNRSFSHYKNIKFIAKDDEISESLFDVHLAVGDLGNFFRRSIKDFSNFSYPYLISDKEKTNSIQYKLRRPKKIICGISWKSVSNKLGFDKTICLNDFEKIFDFKDFLYVDLQYGDTQVERNQLKNKYGVTLNKFYEIDNFNDIDGLASLIDSCDFIVTISNVTAHLAGALGKKVFLMVPYSKGRCWYWHEGLKQSLWYPSVEIFTQSKDGDWSETIKEVHQQIVNEFSV